jgi:hypothetical protein
VVLDLARFHNYLDHRKRRMHRRPVSNKRRKHGRAHSTCTGVPCDRRIHTHKRVVHMARIQHAHRDQKLPRELGRSPSRTTPLWPSPRACAGTPCVSAPTRQPHTSRPTAALTPTSPASACRSRPNPSTRSRLARRSPWTSQTRRRPRAPAMYGSRPPGPHVSWRSGGSAMRGARTGAVVVLS